MLSHFRILPFALGLALGAAVYIFYKPEKQIIRQYPHPKDAEHRIYKDPNGTCYKYKTHEVNCDSHEATLKDYPIQ